MATHLRLFANGAPVVDENGGQIVFINNSQGQADAAAAAQLLIQEVDAVQKYRVAAMIGSDAAISVDITEEQYNSDPIASIGIDEGANAAHLNLTISGNEVVHQPIPWSIRNLVTAEVGTYTEYVAPE